MSSAKSIVVLYRIEFCKSFIYIRNSRGPRHEPCGVPYSNLWYVEYSNCPVMFEIHLTLIDLFSK